MLGSAQLPYSLILNPTVPDIPSRLNTITNKPSATRPILGLFLAIAIGLAGLLKNFDHDEYVFAN